MSGLRIERIILVATEVTKNYEVSQALNSGG